MISGIEDAIVLLRQFHRAAARPAQTPPQALPEDLPRALRRLYEEFGSLLEVPGPGPFNKQDQLVPPSRLDCSTELVTFLWENQGGWSCCYKPGTVDPPVLADTGKFREHPEEGFEKVCGSMEHLLVTFCLQDLVLSCPRVCVLEAKSVESGLSRPLKALWLNGTYAHGEPSHHFWQVGSEPTIVMQMSGELWLGTFLPEAPIRAGVRFHQIAP